MKTLIQICLMNCQTVTIGLLRTLRDSTQSAKDKQKSLGTPVPPLLPNKPVGKKRGPKPSKLWHFFKRSPSDLLVVVCNKCSKKVRRAKAGSDLSKACNSGMVTHLKSAHPEDILLLKRLREGAKAPPTESEVVEPKKEPGKERELWFYFEQLEDGRAACQVGECRARVIWEEGSLKEHLESHQPVF